MAQLLQIFGFLSVLLRGATLTFQSLTIGGIVFLVFVAGPIKISADQLEQGVLRWIRRAAMALAVAQAADRDQVEGSIGLAVTAVVEAVTGRLAGGRGDRARAAEHRE